MATDVLELVLVLVLILVLILILVLALVLILILVLILLLLLIIESQLPRVAIPSMGANPPPWLLRGRWMEVCCLL